MSFSLPTALTWLRIALLPVFVSVFYFPFEGLLPSTQNMMGVALFFIAGLTDWLDGFLARQLGQTSAFGAFLDPVADKCVIVVALILLVDLERTHALFAMIIISREIAVSALREWMAKIGQRNSVAVNWLGKFKTGMQITAIVVLLWHDPLIPFIATVQLGNILMLVAVLLTLLSMFYYLKIAINELAHKDPSQNT